MKNIYMIGICGVAMGSLACMFREAGYTVAGSDKNVYPPMSTVLSAAGIRLDEGFEPAKIGETDLVIIGNSISRGNPQAEYVLNKDIPYCSMAAAIRRFFLQGREVIAVTGTHGKTTTTALLAHILTEAGLDPGWFVGGVAKNFNSNYRLGSGKYFIIEGDEYDSAFFEKIPKFMFYKPRHLIITSLEYDHADIYASLADIELVFRRLVNTIPSEGSIVYSALYSILHRIADGSFSPTVSFGTEGRGDIFCDFVSYDGDTANIAIGPANKMLCRTQLFGDFNMSNIAAASAMALRLGISEEHIVSAIASFQGVKRRQELIFSSPEIRIYEDFAHHPTAVKAVLETMRGRYPHAKIYAVYEPRSATSRRNVLQNELAPAFVIADEVLIKNPFGIESIPENERIDITGVVSEINKGKTNAELFTNVDEIVEKLCREFLKPSSRANPAHIAVIMSNGGFDGIYAKLTGRLGGVL